MFCAIVPINISSLLAYVIRTGSSVDAIHPQARQLGWTHFEAQQWRNVVVGKVLFTCWQLGCSANSNHQQFCCWLSKERDYCCFHELSAVSFLRLPRETGEQQTVTATTSDYRRDSGGYPSGGEFSEFACR